MSMGVDQIGNGSLMQQLEQMNRQMNAMAGSINAPVAPGFQYRDINTNDGQRNDAVVGAAEFGSSVRRSEAGVAAEGTQVSNAGQTVGEFKQLLKDAFENVNTLQNEAGSMQSRFDVGDRSVTLADVMIASQKSGLSFEATLQIRNKLVDAYQSIMQMQI